MKILIVGEQFEFEECRKKLDGHDWTHVGSHQEAEKLLSDNELTFDFLTSARPESFSMYASKPVIVFLNSWKVNLAALARPEKHPLQCTVFGFNGFPTMFNRDVLEVSVLRSDDKAQLKKVCEALKTEFLLVDDRVGFVTPRVICMIINEAYYTVQEGTASRNDIDLAMKLGTNYPYGPFEWCEKIGLKNVYRLLEAVYDDTKDERYKVSGLMKKEYLKSLEIGN